MEGHSEWKLMLLGWQALVAAVHRGINRRIVAFWACFSCLGWFAWVIIFVQVPSCVYHARMSECRQNLHAVQLAMERFSVDAPGSIYPADLDMLIDQGYLDEMPHNPFTGEPMRWVLLAELDLEAPPPAGLNHGDFAYYPRLEKQYMTEPLDLTLLNKTDVCGYTLVLY